MTQAIKLIFHCVVVSRDILRSFAMLLMTITDFLEILFDFSMKKKIKSIIFKNRLVDSQFNQVNAKRIPFHA